MLYKALMTFNTFLSFWKGGNIYIYICIYIYIYCRAYLEVCCPRVGTRLSAASAIIQINAKTGIFPHSNFKETDVNHSLRWRHNGRYGISNHHLAIVYSTVYSGADHRKHQSSASLAFVRRIHRWPVNSPHKWPVTRKMFPFDDVIMF